MDRSSIWPHKGGHCSFFGKRFSSFFLISSYSSVLCANLTICQAFYRMLGIHTLNKRLSQKLVFSDRCVFLVSVDFIVSFPCAMVRLKNQLYEFLVPP